MGYLAACDRSLRRRTALPTRISAASIALFLITAGITATGYVRELALASLFGAGAEVDAFYFSFGLIFASYELIFAGMLASSIVPLLHFHDVDSAASLRARARIVVTATVVVAAAAVLLSAALWLALPHIVSVLAPGMRSDVRGFTIAFGTLL